MKQFNYIYKITNITNGKIYIGKHSTDDLNDGYMGSGKIIKRALNKYGIENFKKEYLVFCDKEDKLNWFERFYIRKYGSTNADIGYNLTKGGDGFSVGNISCMKGKHHSKETRRKMSESAKGKTFSAEHRIHISEVRKGMKFSDEHRIHLSESKKGKRNSPNTEFKKGSEPWNKGKKGLQTGCNHPMFGKHHKKYKWITPDGEIKEMSLCAAHKWHPDWTLVE